MTSSDAEVHMPTLSLNLIARDEEEFLPACLKSVCDIVDEIVVVDTGSLDRTIEIARKAGARVVEFPWSNDFSAARNAALEVSTCDWILVLDADEYLATGAGNIIREVMMNPDLYRVFLPLHNASRLDATPNEILSGNARLGEPTLLARLVRRTQNLHWEGVVHESLVDFTRQGDRSTTQVDAPIIHLGYVKEILEKRGKIQRNLGLLEQRCKEEPGNPFVWGLLAREQMNQKLYGRARQSADKGWKAAEALGALGNSKTELITLASRRAWLMLMSGEVRESLVCLDQVSKWRAFHPNIGLLQGQALYRLSFEVEDPAKRNENLEQAVYVLGNCINCRNKAFAIPLMKGAASWNARSWKGAIELLLDRPEVALGDFEAALSDNPQHLMAQLGRAEALIDMGKPAEAMVQLEPLLQPGLADAWILAAAACEDMGHISRMIGCTQTALGEAKQGLRHRATRLVQLHLAGLIYQGTPQKGPGVLGKLGALTAHIPVEPLIPSDADWKIIHRVVNNLIATKQDDVLKCMLEPHADNVVPGLPEFVSRIIAGVD